MCKDFYFNIKFIIELNICLQLVWSLYDIWHRNLENWQIHLILEVRFLELN